MPKKSKNLKKNFVYALGRRKSASARVKLYKKNIRPGNIKENSEDLVNGQVIGRYFPGEAMRKIWLRPFELTDTLNKYFVMIKVVGGGKMGQLEAVVHGVSKALSVANPEKFKRVLKKAGLLTRDPRIRERRKVGTGGKARRKKQSPKR